MVVILHKLNKIVIVNVTIWAPFVPAKFLIMPQSLSTEEKTVPI